MPPPPRIVFNCRRFLIWDRTKHILRSDTLVAFRVSNRQHKYAEMLKIRAISAQYLREFVIKQLP